MNFLWGFLTVVVSVAFLRGLFGDSTTTRKIVIEAAIGALLVVLVVAWIWFRRHPARLEITPEAIAFRHRGQANPTRLVGPGELAFRTTYIGGSDRLHWLTVTGSEAAISMNMFNHGEVADACRANGWRFVGDP